MSNLNRETVTSVNHWDDKLFSFTTTRDAGFRFENGHFTMLGLENEGKPLLRAYSIASANYEDEMEFLSIKVPDGPLTSRLQNLKVGDEVLVSKKPTGTLTIDGILGGKRLYLLSTGTGLAPFISIIKDPAVYQRFEEIVLVHCVRHRSELAYQNLIERDLPENPWFGEDVRQQLRYYPTVTREPFKNNGRITELMTCGKLFLDLDVPYPTAQDDRFLICGSTAFIKDMTKILDDRGFRETRAGHLGEYAIERAFVG
ncbi:MAG: ferredoxin--NADP reductase [bacterium]